MKLHWCEDSNPSLSARIPVYRSDNEAFARYALSRFSITSHRTQCILLANCWPKRREVQKAAAGWRLGCGNHRLANAIAKFQFQLLTAAFCWPEFFDSCLHLLHRFEHRAIKHLNIALLGNVNIALLGNVRFRVSQDALHHLVRSPQGEGNAFNTIPGRSIRS